MSDVPAKSGVGISKVVAGIISAGLASYAMNWFSLHGVDFSIWKVNSEVVKSTIEGTLVGSLVGLTPHSFVQEVASIIIFCKSAWKTWRDAVNNPVEGNKQ